MPSHVNTAIIGGTGFEALPPDIFAEPVTVTTTFGPVSLLSVSCNYVEPNKLYFLSRHGADHNVAPHAVPYRANIEALIALEVGYVFGANAVGALSRDLPVGTLLLPDDFIDLTRGRERSWYSDDSWKHTDFSDPYSPMLRRAVRAAAAEMGVSIIDSGVYVCTDGPRFETPAEIRMMARLGGDVVGMTGLPEAIMAREAGMEYAALTVVTNPGAGLGGPVEHAANSAAAADVMPILREVLMRAAGLI